jgi:hypothetical protein
MQPPPCTPDCVFDWVHDAPDNWIGCALRKDKQATGLLPPSPLGVLILTGGRICQEAAYRHWKQAVDKLWEDERHRQQAEARQCLLGKCAAHQAQGATCCQCLFDKHTAHKRQGVAHHQQHLNKEVACHQQLMDECTAKSQKIAVATAIFLWLCCCRLHIWLARMTEWRQHQDVALACLQYEHNCCGRATHAVEQQQQAAAARAKALADKANERRCIEAAAFLTAALADEQRCCKSLEPAAVLATLALAKEQTRHAAVECTAATTAAAVKTAMDLAVEKTLVELAASWAAMLVEWAASRAAFLAELVASWAAMLVEWAASRAAFLAALASAVAKDMALAASVLVAKTCHATAVRTEVSARRSLANEHCCRELVQRAAALAANAFADVKEAAGHAWNCPLPI